MNYILSIIFILSLISCEDAKKQPNIIFIMSDDHTNSAISAYGLSLLKTPGIDKLAAEGMRFNNCFNVVSLCGPSRAAILSGQYSAHNGYQKNGDSFNSNLETFPKLLKQNGYQTAVIGKWHLITQPVGFDYYSVIPGQGKFFNCPMKESGQEWQDGGKGGIVQTGYLTDVITDQAIGWLKNRDKSKPFCLLVHHKAPHTPYHYPEKYAKQWLNKTLPEPDNFDDDFEGKNTSLKNGECIFSKFSNIHPDHFSEKYPDSLEIGTQEYKSWAFQHVMKGYHSLVNALDDNITRLINFVDKSGLNKNTIVVYTSDNGWFLGDHGLFNKMWMYEESLKVPLIVRFPENVKPASVSDEMVSVLDFAVTFLDYAGIDKPEQFQGNSIKPILEGEVPENWRTSHFYHYIGQYGVPAHYGIRTTDYKLINFYENIEEPKWELYNLSKDPGEMNNLYDGSKESVLQEDLKKKLMQLIQKYGMRNINSTK